MVPRLSKKNTTRWEYSLLLEAEVLLEEAWLIHAAIGCLKVKALLLHPLVLQKLAHVVPRGIREEDTNLLVSTDVVLHDELVGASHGRAGATTDHKALMTDQASAHSEGFVIAGLDPVVDQLRVAVEHGREEVVADAFHLVGLKLLVACAWVHLVHVIGVRQDAAVWVDSHDLALGHLLLELLGNTCDVPPVPADMIM